jgi:flagellar hook protein FlgE
MSRIESALLTSAQGLDAHGQAIAVIGDNISNANTTAYKTARAEFADLLGEASGDRTAGVVVGGGDGVALKKVRVLQENGVIEPTGRELDVGIAGGGFFMVGDVAAPQYTRSGSFQIDKTGLLTSSTGLPILGYSGLDTTNIGTINMYSAATTGVVTSQVALFGNLNASATNTTPPANPTSFKEIAAAQSFAASQPVYDSLGVRHDIQVAYFKTGPGAWTAQAFIDGGDVGGTAGQPTLVGSASFTFGGNGVIPEANKAQAIIDGKAAYANGATAGAFKIDLSSMTQYAGGSLINNVTQDGQANGNVSKYEFDSDGKVYALLDNGTRSQIGTIPLASFRNVDGLERSGTGVYSATADAGDPVIAAAGKGLLGTLESSSLERSTVDIAGQFVNLVLFQRGYQANSQVLAAANEMIQGTLGLLR